MARGLRRHRVVQPAWDGTRASGCSWPSAPRASSRVSVSVAASTADRPMAETFFAVRHHPNSRLA